MKMNRHLSVMVDCNEVMRLAKAASSDHCYAKAVNTGRCRVIPVEASSGRCRAILAADDNLDQSACQDANPAAE